MQMAQQIIINGHHLRHFTDISTLGIDPISLKICCKQRVTLKLLDKIDKPVKINHDCLIQSLTKKNGFFLDNFRHVGLVICLMSDGSNINNYQALRKQLISIYNDLLNKVITLHKQECNQIGLNPNHSSLKYLNLPSKRVMILKHDRKHGDCKVCLRGVKLINFRLWMKYGHNLYLTTMSQLSDIVSLSSISQQWILSKKKLKLESIDLENIDDNKYNFDNVNCSSSQTYEQLLHDMNIIGQLRSFACPFYVSENFSQVEMIANASNFYRIGRFTDVGINMCFFICFICIVCYYNTQYLMHL